MSTTPAPEWMRLAKAEIGVEEHRNPDKVMGYAKDGHISDYADPRTPWCAVFVGAILERCGVKSTRSPAARSYMQWGKKLDKPVYGCVVVLTRGRSTWQGHVGFYEGDAGNYIRLLSGNTADSVCSKLFPKSSVLAYRGLPEVKAVDTVVAKVPNGPTHIEDGVPGIVVADAAPVLAEQAKPAEASTVQRLSGKTQAEVRADLKRAGSRTIFGVDRIVHYVRALMAVLGITSLSDVVSTKQNVEQLVPAVPVTDYHPIVWAVIGTLALCIMFEAWRIENARVDDQVNGQQTRGLPENA